MEGLKFTEPLINYVFDTISYMIYNDSYQIKFYKDSRTGKEPVLVYLESLNIKSRQKINKYLELLERQNGYLDEPYSRHISGKIRELRVVFFMIATEFSILLFLIKI